MKGATVGVVAICLGIWGCGGDRERTETGASAENTADVRPAPITATGCLTARGDQFVLTDLEREGQPTTETYQLIGNQEQLRPHVGKQVRVNGEAKPAQVATMQESTPAASKPQPQGTAGGADPKVTTQAETRVEVRELTVSSIQPTGEGCAAEAKEDEGAGRKPRQ